jgi:hypothetical protein
MKPVETIPRIGEGGIKENNGGDECNYDILKELCKCHNVPPVQQ